MNKKNNGSTTRLTSIFIPLLLIIATLAVFWPVAGYEFVSWDDDLNVYANRFLNPVTVENTLHFWSEPFINMYLPLVYTLWSILGWLSQYMPAEPYGLAKLATGGLNPHIFHAANLIIHLFNTLIVFSILKMLLSHGFREGGDDSENPDPSKVEIAAGIGALIFALHPVQIQPVVWITGMKDILCGFFSFLAIREYLAYAVAAKSKNATVKIKSIHYILACAAFLLALLSKPAAVIVPLILLILDRWAIKRSLKESAIALAGWFVAAFVFAVIAKSVQQGGTVIITVPLWARPFIAGDALAFYLYKLAVPWQLGIDYGRTPDYVLRQWWGYVTWIFPFVILVGVMFLKRRGPILVSLGIFTAALLPVLGFISFIFQNQSTVADHYLYIPMLGAALCISWLFLNHQRKLTGIFILALTVFFVVRSYYHLPVWKNSIALYTNALKINPVSFISHNNLGILLAQRENPDEAIRHYEIALKIRPGQPDAHNNLGVALKKDGRLEEAAIQFKKAIENRNDSATAHNNLGKVLGKQGKLEEAVFHFNEAIKFQPDYPLFHDNLGVALAKNGNFDEAIIHFSEAVRIKPDFEIAKRHLETARAQARQKIK